MFEGSYKGVSRKIWGCSERTLMVIQGYLKEVQRGFKGVSRKFQRNFKEVTRVFKETVKCVSRKCRKKFQDYIKNF